MSIGNRDHAPISDQLLSSIMKSKGNRIIRQLFEKAEVSYTLSDISKAIGPVIDLVFIALFIGTDGVTVVGCVSPLIVFF